MKRSNEMEIIEGDKFEIPTMNRLNKGKEKKKGNRDPND